MIFKFVVTDSFRIFELNTSTAQASKQRTSAVVATLDEAMAKQEQRYYWLA
jgi:hypothetical protein